MMKKQLGVWAQKGWSWMILKHAKHSKYFQPVLNGVLLGIINTGGKEKTPSSVPCSEERAGVDITFGDKRENCLPNMRF